HSVGVDNSATKGLHFLCYTSFSHAIAEGSLCVRVALPADHVLAVNGHSRQNSCEAIVCATTAQTTSTTARALALIKSSTCVCSCFVEMRIFRCLWQQLKILSTSASNSSPITTKICH